MVHSNGGRRDRAFSRRLVFQPKAQSEIVSLSPAKAGFFFGALNVGLLSRMQAPMLPDFLHQQPMLPPQTQPMGGGPTPFLDGADTLGGDGGMQKPPVMPGQPPVSPLLGGGLGQMSQHDLSALLGGGLLGAFSRNPGFQQQLGAIAGGMGPGMSPVQFTPPPVTVQNAPATAQTPNRRRSFLDAFTRNG